MNTKRFAVAALLIGLFGIACEVAQVVLYESHLSTEWSYPANAWNYLAFFTVITNLLICLWFILISISIFAKWKRLYNLLTKPEIMGALVLYIATVSIVYCTLLFWFIGPYSMTLWWANIIDMWNHLVLPVIFVVLWFLISRDRRMKWRTLLYWLIFPLLYFVLSEIRGLVWDWYPYPFLRPSWIMFPLGLLVTTLCFVGLGSLLIWTHNKKTPVKESS